MYTRTCLPITNLNNLKSLPEPDKSNKTKIAWIKSISRQNPKWSMLVNEIFVCSCCSFAVSREKIFLQTASLEHIKTHLVIYIKQVYSKQTFIDEIGWLVAWLDWSNVKKPAKKQQQPKKWMDWMNEWINMVCLRDKNSNG